MRDLYDKPVHEICVDKTSCRHETSLDEAAGKEKKQAFTPTSHLTKDAVRKAYEKEQQQGGPNR